MSFAAEPLRQGVRRVLMFQALLTLLVAAVFGVVSGLPELLSTLYGGAVAVLLSAMLGRGVLRATGLGSLYANMITRYGAAILFLGLGFSVIRLAPLPLIVAFAVSQFGFLADMRRR